MEYGLTGKLQKKLKVDTLQDPTEQEPAYCWEVNFDIAFRKMIVFIVNASSRFAVIAFGLKPADLRKNLPGIAEGLIRQAMRDNIGLPESAIDAYFKAAGEAVLTKTHGRKLVGRLNRLMQDAPPWRAPIYTDIVYQDELTDIANHDIFKSGEGDTDYSIVMEYAINDLLRLGIISPEKGNMPRTYSYEQLKNAVMKLQMSSEVSREAVWRLQDAVRDTACKRGLTKEEHVALNARLTELLARIHE